MFSQNIPQALNTSNIICRGCLILLTQKHEIEDQSCQSCYSNSNLTIRRYNSFPARRKQALIEDISYDDISTKTSTILKHFQDVSKEVEENSTSLKKILDLSLRQNIEEIYKFKQKMLEELIKAEKLLKSNLHLSNPSIDNPELRLLSTLLSKNNFKKELQVLCSIDIERINENIRKSSVKVCKTIENFSEEPVLNHFSSLSDANIMIQLSIYLNQLRLVSLVSDSTTKWPSSGSYIEYKPGFTFFAGRNGFFSEGGLWSIVHSGRNKAQSFNFKICGFDNVQGHSLEYFEGVLYVIGGNSKEIKALHIDEIKHRDWLTVKTLPAGVKGLGITHSVLVNDVIHFVGNSCTYYNLFDLKTKSLKCFELAQGNKIIFCHDNYRFVFLNGKVRVYCNDQIEEFKHGADQKFNDYRCPGKAKVLYPYLYFITANCMNTEDGFKVWRFSVKNFHLENLIVKNRAN